MADADRSIARLSMMEVSVTALADEDLRDLAGIFATDEQTPLYEMAHPEMAKRDPRRSQRYAPGRIGMVVVPLHTPSTSFVRTTAGLGPSVMSLAGVGGCGIALGDELAAQSRSLHLARRQMRNVTRPSGIRSGERTAAAWTPRSRLIGGVGRDCPTLGAVDRSDAIPGAMQHGG